ncbi:MAG: efflux RND transporter periplasmic adaptor subunit [Bacteroidetes bacterium]|nr:efflux RND transporter periplasmic adaptor subunit [Bacteroidota bacterium]
MKKYIFIITILSIFSCDKPKEKNETIKNISADGTTISINNIQKKNAGITISSPKDLSISNTIKLTGSIDVPPQGLASVSAPSGGYVRKSQYMPGDIIAKGQVLAILEDPAIVQLQQDYLLAQSNSQYAKKDFVRQKELNTNQASSDKVMQKAQNEAQNQNILVKGMAQKLRSLGINPDHLTPNTITKTVTVRSPISGYISSVKINLGQYVSPNEKLFEIVNTSDTHLVLKVFEKDLQYIKKGQKVFAYTNEDPQKKWEAEIILISQDFAADRSVVVHCHFQKYDPHLIPGTFMNAEVEINNQNGATLPEDAVVTWENQQYIFEETKPNTFTMTKVAIGNSENGNTQILNLPTNFYQKKIVTKGAYQLLMALKNIED